MPEPDQQKMSHGQGAPINTDFSRLIANAQSLVAEDKVVMQKYMEAALQTVAHRKANPEYVLPPHFCTTHGMCYHESAKCNAKKHK
jgi:hypothetical protein